MNKYAVLAALLLLLGGAATAQSYNSTEAQQALKSARASIHQMEEQGIPTSRVQNLLDEAEQAYRAQKTLAEQGGDPDFSRVVKLTGDIQELEDNSIEVKDRLEALKIRLEELNSSGLNLTEARNKFQEANRSFQEQRFEEAGNLIEESYSAISDAQSVQTRFQAFASAQRQNIIGVLRNAAAFASDNWIKLSLAGVFLFFAGITGYRKARVWQLSRLISKQETKKKVLDHLIEEAQHDYFVKGEGSKISFETRMDRFEDMKRETEERINTLESARETEMDKFFYLGDEPEIPEPKDGEPDRYDSLVQETVKEAKRDIESMDEPDYEEILEKEKENKDRVTLERYVKDKIEHLHQEKRYEQLLTQHTVKEVKQELREIEEPDYQELLAIEKQNKNRLTLRRYLRRRLPDDERPGYNELVSENTVEEVKQELENMDSPDYRAVLEAEKRHKDRKTLKNWLEERV